nr:hypothetical protein BaRGS_019894 [Batillaria attramentaria]
MAAYRWRERHVLHKLGSVGLVPATLLFVVGFSVPAWRLGVGLWTRCQFEVCISDVSHNSTPMLYAVLTSECVALFLFLLSLCATVYQEFYKNPAKPDDRLVEVSATAAGVFSMTGVVIYGVEVGDIRHLDWGYGLVISASLLALLSALLIACTRHKDASLESPSNSSSFSMATRQGPQPQPPPYEVLELEREKQWKSFRSRLADFPHSFLLDDKGHLTQDKLKRLEKGLQSALGVGHETVLETARARNLLGYVHWLSKDSTQALLETEKVLAMDGQQMNILSLANKAVMLWWTGDLKEAEKQVDMLDKLRSVHDFDYLLVKAKAELAFSYTRFGPKYISTRSNECLQRFYWDSLCNKFVKQQ